VQNKSLGFKVGWMWILYALLLAIWETFSISRSSTLNFKIGKKYVALRIK
jgi:hypothetical protein